MRLGRADLGQAPCLTEVQAAEVLRRSLAGDRPINIAGDFDVSEWTVQDVRRRGGVASRPHDMTNADFAHAARLHAPGDALLKAAIETGLAAATVSKVLRRCGYIRLRLTDRHPLSSP